MPPMFVCISNALMFSNDVPPNIRAAHPASMVANCFAAPRAWPARGGQSMLESTRRTLTNGSSGGLCWTLYVEVVRCVVGLTAADGAVVVSRSARLRSWSASGGDRGCCTRVGTSKGRLFATRVRTPAPFIVFELVSHAHHRCTRQLCGGSTLHFHLVRARCDDGAVRASAHLPVRARGACDAQARRLRCAKPSSLLAW